MTAIEQVDEPTGTAIEVASREVSSAPVPIRAASPIVKLAAPVADIVAAVAAYHDAYDKILTASDFQVIGKKKFPKKSAWRKLSLAFNVNLGIVSRDYERDEVGRIIRAEVVAFAEAPNGRRTESIGACDLFEKCCNPRYCKNKADYHKHCEPGCPGAHHFSNPQHDLPSTAETRAKNRAAADLFGMGEVSAEELNAERAAAEAADEERASAFQPMQQLGPYLGQLTAASRLQLSEWRKAEELPNPREMDPAQVAQTLIKMAGLIAAQDADGEIPVDAPPSPHPAASDPDEAPFEMPAARSHLDTTNPHRDELDSLYLSQGKAALTEEVVGADDRYIDEVCVVRGIEGPLLRDQLI